MEIRELSAPFRSNKVMQVHENNDFYSIDTSELEGEQKEIEAKGNFEEHFKPVLEGTIEKKTMNISWQARYFTLTPTKLLYFENSSKRCLKGCFNLASLLNYGLWIEESDGKIIFGVLSAKPDNLTERKQILVLNFQNEPHLLQIWYHCIKSVISQISATDRTMAPKLTDLQIQSPFIKIYSHNYWNRIIISNEQLMLYAHHMDLVFFKSKAPIASFHRMLMRSSFDHIGLLIRDSLDRLLVLEAIESRGVWINEWNTMLPSFRQHYQEIAYRKLITKNKQINVDKLEAYLDIVIGQKYELSISKLIMGDNESTNEDLENIEPNKKPNHIKFKSQGIIRQKEKTFFCSELVADAYIKCGIIKGKKRNEFWPKDFESNELELENGMILSPLMYLNQPN